MNKKTCFEIRVSYSFNVPNNSKTINQTSTYKIVANSKDEACDTARYLNQTEYGDTLNYRYNGLAIINKSIVYMLNN